jgi:hypothetical protein
MMPVTLRTLYGFKVNKGWTGEKVAAHVFHQLHSQRKIVKAEVQSHVEEALDGRDSSTELLNIMQDMVEAMADEESFPVSKITTFNTTVVKEAVAKRIKSIV